MKKLLTTFCFLCCGVLAFAQIPQATNYQAIVRSNAGAVLANQSVNVRFTIRSSNPNGALIYQETHTAITNAYGLINLALGTGAPQVGSFASINWAGNTFYLGTEVDAGAGFVNMGTTQFLSVPYALSAQNVANLGLVAGNGITVNGATITNAGDTNAADDITNGTTANGDLNGTYPNPTVDGIQGRAVANTAPNSGEVLKWNGSAWAPAADAAGANTWTTNGNNIFNNNVGNVGIGADPTGTGKLQVATDGSLAGGAFVSNVAAGTVGAALTLKSARDYSIFSSNTGAASGSGRLVIHDRTAGVDRLVIDDQGRVGVGMSNPSVAFQMSSTTIQTMNVPQYPYAVNPSLFFAKMVQSNAADNVGVAGYAENPSNSYWSIGGLFTGGGTASNSYGTYSQAKSANNGANYACYATAANGATNYAGYFVGNVNVTGTLSKGGGTFKIDHPLDPENKYLYHSFVESPDMMNIYNGNVTTDANGEAWVQLPDYFEALNMDFRYQLTSVGQFAQAIVGEEISGNKFMIRTDKANVKVSWQVTGVRKDPFANQNRVVPEVEKSDKEKGRYLYPAAYGKPATMGVAPENDHLFPKD